MRRAVSVIAELLVSTKCAELNFIPPTVSSTTLVFTRT